MKRIGILLTVVLISSLPALAQTPLHKKITVDFRGQPVAEALKDVGKLVGVRIAFAEKLLVGTDPVSFQAKDQEAGRVLTRILRPRGLTLSLKGNLVAVSQRNPGDRAGVKRQETFGFKEKPTVSRHGDRVTVRFETKGLCDVTVAVEDANGKIIRHLACGVLGENAPEPFVWNSKKQVIVWDGKNDKDKYVDDKDSCVVRVSQGLKARYERNLMWCPKKRGPTVNSGVSGTPPPMAPTSEGMYVFDGDYVGEHVRLFNHEGDYVRSVYPFPAGKLRQVKGLKMGPGPGLNPARYQNELITMLTISSKKYGESWPVVLGAHSYGITPPGMAVQGNRIALAGWRLNRLATDGSTGGLELSGPGITYKAKLRRLHEFRGGTFDIHPRSVAFDPKGEYLYMTGYAWNKAWNQDGLHGLMRVRWNSNEAPQPFVGSIAQGKAGKDDAHLCFPLDVACDAEGRVYVSDYMNDRVQVFSPAGKVLKTVSTPKPVDIDVHPKTGELWVFSWVVGNDHLTHEYSKSVKQHKTMKDMRATLTCFEGINWKESGKEAKPKITAKCSLSDLRISTRVKPYMGCLRSGLQYRAVVDFWAKEPVIWFRTGTVRLYERKGKKLKLIRDFGKDVAKEDPQPRAPYHGRQRLYFDHRGEKLYVGEQFPDPLHIKSFRELIRLDPKTGKGKRIALPFDAEDMAFDMEGSAYLRTMTQIVRYDARTWREIPFDYGEELRKVSYSRARSGRHAGKVNSGVVCHLEGNSSSQFYGMWVSPKDYIVITGCHRTGKPGRNSTQKASGSDVKKYSPPVYAGRPWGSLVHIFDKHGRMVYDDALPGANYFQGVAMDKNNNLYIQHSGMPPGANGKYPAGVHPGACTLIKAKVKSRFLTGKGIIPLPKAAQPKRPPDFLSNAKLPVWIQQADWMYGGTGLSTKAGPGGNCHCFGNSRFGFDYFERSFVSELQQYRVSVLDGNGNIILRIGRYGNIDDGVPLVKKMASPAARSIGGDEVALQQALYLAAQTDKRLFVADIGNYRIFSVKLDYHAEEKIALKDVPDEKK